MSKLPTKHEGQFRKKSQKGSNGSQKLEAEHVTNFRNLRNSTGCENSQPYKISAIGHFSSVCGSDFLPTSVVSFEFDLDSLCLD